MAQPNEPLTLTGALEQLTRRGFTATFEASAGGLQVRQSGRTYRPEDLSIRESYRFEGVSDPDDLSALYAIEASDGTRGTLVDGYGIYADPAMADVLRRIPV
ncbi:MAG: hypothetical protein ACREMB_02190, partial [Candidatus Rokuibacteriota bacterium]